MKIYQLEFSQGSYDDYRCDTEMVTTSLGDIYDWCSRMGVTGSNRPYQLWITVWENGKVLRYKDLNYLLRSGLV